MELIIVLILSFICVLLWISPSSRKAEPITVGVQTEEENKKDIGVQTDQTDPRAINFRLPVQAIEYQKLAPRRKPMKFADDYDPCEGTSRNQNLFNHEANSEDNNTVDGGQTRSRSSKRRNTDYDPQEGSSGSKTRMTRSTENVPAQPIDSESRSGDSGKSGKKRPHEDDGTTPDSNIKPRKVSRRITFEKMSSNPEFLVNPPPRSMDWNETAGTIMHVKMKDFMCHYSMNYEPNPRLNFLIGANGSGKSAISTAVGKL